MAKKKKKDSKSKARRESLKSFARRGTNVYTQKYSSDKELVYGNGKNYKVGPGLDFSSADNGATAADNDGKAFIYLDGTLYTTAGGRARAANRANVENAGAGTLELTIAN